MRGPRERVSVHTLSDRTSPMLYFDDLHEGDAWTSGGYAISEDEIIDFARRWDPQPWHVDREAAAVSPMQGITASSAHTYAVTARLLNTLGPFAGIASIRHEFELPAPVRPGDVLTLTLECETLRPSRSKPDRGLVTFASRLVTGTGATVLRMRSLMLLKQRAAAGDPARP